MYRESDTMKHGVNHTAALLAALAMLGLAFGLSSAEATGAAGNAADAVIERRMRVAVVVRQNDQLDRG